MAKKRKTAALPPLMLAIKAGDIDKVTSLLEGHDRMTWKEVVAAIVVQEYDEEDRNRQIVCLQKISESGCLINVNSGQGEEDGTALCVAAAHGRIDITNILTEAHASWTHSASEAKTPFLFAVLGSHYNVAAAAVSSAYQDGDVPTGIGLAFLLNVARGNTAAARRFLQSHAGTEKAAQALNMTEGNYNAIILAILSENASAVKLIVKDYGSFVTKETINFQGVGGATALLEASKFGDVPCIELLLKHKDIDANRGDNEGVTPLMEAVNGSANNNPQTIQKYLAIAKMLLARNADIHQKETVKAKGVKSTVLRYQSPLTWAEELAKDPATRDGGRQMVALFNAASGGGGGGTKVFQKGDQVMSYYEGRKGQKYPAVVVQSNEDGTYEIRFDDGDRENSVRSEHMTLNATKSGGGGGGSSSTTKKKKPGGKATTSKVASATPSPRSRSPSTSAVASNTHSRSISASTSVTGWRSMSTEEKVRTHKCNRNYATVNHGGGNRPCLVTCTACAVYGWKGWLPDLPAKSCYGCKKPAAGIVIGTRP